MTGAPRLTWDVDDRPATAWTRAYVRAMWLARDKHAFEGAEHTLAAARHKQRQGNAPPTRWTRASRRVSRAEVDGMPVWTVRPRRGTPVARVLYVHGGGYVHPLTPDYWRLVRALAATPAEVVVPAYPLAPDSSVDDALPRLLDLERSRREADPLPTVLMGDSAGGALVLVLAQRLRDLGRPLPAAVVGLSPWLDATLSQPSVADLEASDPMLAESGLRAAGRWWGGGRGADHPLVTPLTGDLGGLPPLEVLIGDRDILRPAVERLRDLAEDAGAELHVHEVTAMFHVWMTRAVPEAARTRRLLRRLVAGHAARPAARTGSGRR